MMLGVVPQELFEFAPGQIQIQIGRMAIGQTGFPEPLPFHFGQNSRLEGNVLEGCQFCCG